MPHDRVPLGRLVADAAVVGERGRTAPLDLREPHFIRRVMSKVIGVPLDIQAACPNIRAKLLSEVAVGEVDAGQAARS